MNDTKVRNVYWILKEDLYNKKIRNPFYYLENDKYLIKKLSGYSILTKDGKKGSDYHDVSIAVNLLRNEFSNKLISTKNTKLTLSY